MYVQVWEREEEDQRRVGRETTGGERKEDRVGVVR